jgi:hypothetical protein
MEFPERLLRQGAFRRRKIRRDGCCSIHAYSITQIRWRINQSLSENSEGICGGGFRWFARTAGFRQVEIKATRTAEKDYLAAIQPRLRAAARRQPLEDIAVIEFTLTAVK